MPKNKHHQKCPSTRPSSCQGFTEVQEKDKVEQDFQQLDSEMTRGISLSRPHPRQRAARDCRHSDSTVQGHGHLTLTTADSAVDNLEKLVHEDFDYIPVSLSHTTGMVAQPVKFQIGAYVLRCLFMLESQVGTGNSFRWGGRCVSRSFCVHLFDFCTLSA